MRYFLAVAREENITKAAALLHLTQPTLSRQLMQLEEELGVQLFHRSRYHIVLTDEGMLLRRRGAGASRLGGQNGPGVCRPGNRADGRDRHRRGRNPEYDLPLPGYPHLSGALPKVTFRLFSANADDVKERLDMGLLDMGLLTEPVDVGKYAFFRMQEKTAGA